jgi:hypothetical protein
MYKVPTDFRLTDVKLRCFLRSLPEDDLIGGRNMLKRKQTGINFTTYMHIVGFVNYSIKNNMKN